MRYARGRSSGATSVRCCAVNRYPVIVPSMISCDYSTLAMARLLWITEDGPFTRVGAGGSRTVSTAGFLRAFALPWIDLRFSA